MLKVSTEIYYAGDIANLPGKGIITKCREGNKYAPASVDIAMEDGREFSRISISSFSPSPGRRFYTMEEWREKRRKEIEAMQKRLEEMGILSVSWMKEGKK